MEQAITLIKNTKYIIKKGVAFLFCILSFIITGCGNDTHTPTAVECSTMIDVTGSNTSINSSDAITRDVFKILEIEKNKKDGVTYRQTLITAVSYNRNNEVHLEKDAPYLMSNKSKRKKQILAFKDKVKELISVVESDKKGRGSSSIYRPMALELHKLKKSDATKKVLLIYSDLEENVLANFQLNNYSDLEEVFRNQSEKVAEHLQKTEPLPDDLSGITIYFIQESDGNRNKEQQAVLYDYLAEFYKNLLESKGATVIVGANV